MTEKFNDEEELQVKSKERVKDFGEVFTNQREVNAMLDLVKDESYRVDSRFLEPACGNGNFLIEILARKLQRVNEVAKNRQEWEWLTLVGLGSVYAIDIQNDNIEEARERLLNHIKEVYEEKFSEELSLDYLSTLNEVLVKNIIHGDGLTGLQHGVGAGKEILFSEWSFDNWLETGEVIRKDFSMNEMIAHNKRVEAAEKITSQAGSLFSLISQEQEIEPLRPQNTKIYKNFLENNNEMNLTKIILSISNKINKMSQKFHTFVENNKEEMIRLIELIQMLDEEKLDRLNLAFEKIKDDEYILHAPLSDVEIVFLNENGYEDKENGNFFFIQLKSGYKTKIKKLDDSIPGKYLGKENNQQKNIGISILQIIASNSGIEAVFVIPFLVVLELMNNRRS